eukprot:10632881-Lingulodinium_polyedra.AAC.1
MARGRQPYLYFPGRARESPAASAPVGGQAEADLQLGLQARIRRMAGSAARRGAGGAMGPGPQDGGL